MKHYSIQCLLVLLLDLISVNCAYSYDFSSNGICYNITSMEEHTVEVASNGRMNYKGKISIPKKVTDGQNVYTVTAIGEDAFLRCRDIISIELPPSLESIGSGAFVECLGLTSIKFPESLNTIGSIAFYDCRNLTSIEFPSSVTVIGAKAFYLCSNLTSIELPSSLTILEANAFNCKNLVEVICHALIPPSEFAKNDIFANETYIKGILKVPTESISLYENTYSWGQFWNIEGISTSGINDVIDSKNNVTIKIVGIGNIVLEKALGIPVTICSVDGIMKYQTANYCGESIILCPGIYVVKCGNKVLKVRL